MQTYDKNLQKMQRIPNHISYHLKIATVLEKTLQTTKINTRFRKGDRKGCSPTSGCQRANPMQAKICPVPKNSWLSAPEPPN